MTCGGTVKLFFETYNHSDWRIVVFGAGHVASEVVELPGPARLPRHVHRSAGRMARPHSRPRGRLRKIRCDEPRTIVAELPDDCVRHLHDDGPRHRPADPRRDLPPGPQVSRSSASSAARRSARCSSKNSPPPASRRSKLKRFTARSASTSAPTNPAKSPISVVAQLIQERDRWRGLSSA